MIAEDKTVDNDWDRLMHILFFNDPQGIVSRATPPAGAGGFPNWGSTRRPGEPTAGQKMEMNVEDGLSRVKTVIDDHAVSALIKPLLGSNGFGYIEQMSDELPVGNGNGMNIYDMFFRDDQGMHRCLGIDVLKGNGIIVFVDNPRRDLFLYNFAKNTVRIRVHLLSPSRLGEKLLKKQHREPVWQAGPVCSTLIRSVS